MSAYYNEHEPFAAQWLRNLIAAGHIAPGDVDERDIQDVSASDLAGYDQVHFFAGIGGWSHALRLAGVPDTAPVWTGSCPCQPFSPAGKQLGVKDPRHLWPAFSRLIAERRPPIVFGEQVAGEDGLGWLDLVSDDLEGMGYAVGAADLCAAGVSAPHRRQRLYWLAYAADHERSRVKAARKGRAGFAHSSEIGGLAYTERRSAERHGLALGRETGSRESREEERQRVRDDARNGGELGGLVYAGGERRNGKPVRLRERKPREEGAQAYGRGDAGFWSNAEWLSLRDGTTRPIEPGSFPLAHGLPGRVGQLRAYGNAIVPQVAAEFVSAALECIP